LAIDDLYAVKMVFTESGLGKVYRPGFQVRQAGASFSLAAIGDACKAFWQSHGVTLATRAYYATEIELTRVEVRRIEPLEDLVQEYTTGLPIAGTSTADRLSPENAPLLSHRTGLIGRSNRGRTYLPAPTEDANDEPGWWTAAFVEDILDSWADSIATLGGVGTLLPQTVVTAFSGHTWAQDEHGNWHKIPTERTTKLSNDVTETRMDRRVRSQRPRNVKTPVYST
jgi:hypothetical protein